MKSSFWAVLAASILGGTYTYTNAEEILYHWDFDSEELPFIEVEDCDLSVQNGILIAEATGNDVALHFPLVAKGPVRVLARIRSGEGAFGRAEIFWKDQSGEKFSQDKASMYHYIHDMEWREYDFGLPITDAPAYIRMDLGWKPGLFEIDWIKVVHDPLSKDIMEKISSLPEEISISNETLDVSFASEGSRFSITDKRSGREWFLDGSSMQAYVTGVEKTDSSTLSFELWDQATRSVYTSVATLKGEGILHFSLNTGDPQEYFWALRAWPPRIDADLDEGQIVFADRSSGTLLAQDDHLYYADRELTIYGNTQCADMPWVGLFDMEDGDGVMTLAETPTDGHFAMRLNEDEHIRPQLRWLPSMDKFGYQREMSYRFVHQGGYVALSKMYREYIEEIGLSLTYDERLADKPLLERLRGAAIIWGARDLMAFLYEVRPEGLTRAFFGNPHHGVRDSEPIEEANSLGYLTGPYDSFSDIYDGPTGFQTDDVDETAYHARPGLGPKGGWVTADGFRYSDRSSAFALRALKTYVPEQIEQWGFNSRFVDVSMAISLHEDWHPEHTFDRRQDLAYRRDAFSYLANDLNLPLGTEHGNDWGVDLVDFFEGSVGGPFHWKTQGTWNSGMLQRPTNSDDYREEYLHFGVNPATSIPIWQLVYQDSTFSTYYWGDTPGFHYEAAPEISDTKDLFVLLYGGNPMLWRDRRGYRWPDDRERFMQSYHDTAHFNYYVVGQKMTNHEFLSEDRMVQRSHFSNDTVITVNFDRNPREVTLENGQSVELAALGYFTEANDYTQFLVLENGMEKKQIVGSGYREFRSPIREELHGVSYEGTFKAFHWTPGNEWGLVLQPSRYYSIDVAELTGWDRSGSVTLWELDEVGQKRRILLSTSLSETIDFQTSKEGRHYLLEPSAVDPDDSIHIYPASGELNSDKQVIISSLMKNVEIRYTTDGSRVSPKSEIYRHPIKISDDSNLRVQAFQDGRRTGEEAQRDYHVYDVLVDTGLMTSFTRPQIVKVSVQDYEEFQVIVEDGGDGPWNDLANFADAHVVMKDGTRVPLSSIEPLSHIQTVKELFLDELDEGDPITIEDTVYEKGLALQSNAKVVYRVEEDWAFVEGILGVEGTAYDKAPTVPATIVFKLLGVRHGSDS